MTDFVEFTVVGWDSGDLDDKSALQVWRGLGAKNGEWLQLLHPRTLRGSQKEADGE